MADQFLIVPHMVKSAGTDVPPEQIQFALNKMANDVTNALNTLGSGESSNVNITGGTITGVTGATQSRIDNSLLLATDQFVNQQIASSQANVPIPLTGGVYNQASLGTGVTFVIFASGGVISSVITIVNGGTGYAVGDLLLVVGGNTDALLRVTNVVGGVIQSGGLQVLYGGTGYTTALTLAAVPVPPGQRTVTATGVLTSNVTFIIQNGTFLTAARRIQFNNNTTGAFTVTIFLSNGLGGTTGAGIVVPQGTNNNSAVLLETDGMNDVWLADTPLGIGALTSANPTFTGTLTGPTISTTAMSRVMASTTNAQSIGTGAFTTITTWTTTLNQGANFVASTGVYTAPAAGLYDVRAAVRFTAGTAVADSQCLISVFVNGAAVYQAGTTQQNAVTTIYQAHGAWLVNLNASDVVTVRAFQNSGAALTLDTTPVANWLNIARLP